MKGIVITLTMTLLFSGLAALLWAGAYWIVRHARRRPRHDTLSVLMDAGRPVSPEMRGHPAGRLPRTWLN